MTSATTTSTHNQHETMKTEDMIDFLDSIIIQAKEARLILDSTREPSEMELMEILEYMYEVSHDAERITDELHEQGIEV